MRRTQSFIRYFTDVDLVDVEFTLERNRVIGLCLNYRAYILGGWREVVRYDNARGTPLHVHRFWPPQAGGREYLETEVRTDYMDAVEESLCDLEANWRAYRRNVEENARHDP